jgi:hypothetical protein
MGRQSTDWLILTSIPTFFPVLLILISPFNVAIKLMVIGATITLYTVTNLTNRSAYLHKEPVFALASMITAIFITLSLLGFGIVYSFSTPFLGIPAICVGTFFFIILLQTGRRELRYIKRIQKSKIDALQRRRKGIPVQPKKSRVQIIKEREAEVERRALERLDIMLNNEGQEGTG